MKTGTQRPPAPRAAERRRILVVEDESDIAELVRFNLEQEGFEAAVAGDGQQALAAIKRAVPALVILDLMLPRMPGIEVCRRLRSDPDTAHLPIVMLTARAAEIDRVLGLEAGADDYVVKPFSPRELIARVRAVLRRAHAGEIQPPHQVYERGRLRVDLDSYEVALDGTRIELPLREFELLRFFVASPNRVFDRLAILDLVWGHDTYVEPRTVDVHVRRLRARLERDDARPTLIVTVRGAGYKFDERALDT